MESSSSSSFPFQQLPLDLQESILSLLPISTLIRCSAASRSLRGLIRSPSFLSCFSNPNPNPLFLFSDGLPSIADAYDPLLDRWLSFPIPPNTLSVDASAGPLLLSSSPTNLLVSDLFSSSQTPTRIPTPVDLFSFYPLALISETPNGGEFKIVMVSTAGGRISSRVFDSRTREWAVGGEFGGLHAVIGSAAFLDGLLYCLARGPDRLLTFDPVGGEWKPVDLDFPASQYLHVLVFDGRLFLVGGVEELGVMARIGIWELHLVRRQWEVFCFMPEDVFVVFSKGVNHFQMVDRKGKICFVSKKRSTSRSILMCDLAVKRWWWTRAREGRSFKMHYRLVYAVEPYIDLVNANR